MASYKELLESEMQASEEFTHRNFGLKIGDEFPDMVRELVSSDKISVRLLLSLLMGAMMGNKVGESLKDGDRASAGRAVLNNLTIFETPLALFYWGVQVGRKMERESASVLQNIESSDGH